MALQQLQRLDVRGPQRIAHRVDAADEVGRELGLVLVGVDVRHHAAAGVVFAARYADPARVDDVAQVVVSQVREPRGVFQPAERGLYVRGGEGAFES